MSLCPSDEQLTGLLADALSAAERDSLAQHVEGCAACQEQLARLTGTADLERWWRAEHPLPNSEAEADVVRRLKGMPPWLAPTSPKAEASLAGSVPHRTNLRPGAVGSELLRGWLRRHPLATGLLAASLLAPVVALIALSLLSARLVRASALESAAQQAELLEAANNEYSRIVTRVEQANFPVNKTVPPTPGTVPLSVPATFLHDIGEQLAHSSRTGIKVRQYSDYPFPWRTDNGPRDEFERAALLRLRQSKGQETVHEFTEIDGQRVVRYAQARVLLRTCVECHNTHPQSPRKDWQEGDVRGVLVIIRPLGKEEARVGEALHLALLLSALVSGLLLGGSMLVVWVGRRRIQVGS